MALMSVVEQLLRFDSTQGLVCCQLQLFELTWIEIGDPGLRSRLGMARIWKDSATESWDGPLALRSSRRTSILRPFRNGAAREA